ncbi:hypothetical protein F2Q69_00015997 [Brassica cretica]|uniref:Uncharacterized protein n=1 Tax=Brassica cretica TaxID=69181 RepID=A0A8S9QRT2_BRACR|nr:hypothetical protein F2Q69_00015997 [Brassica cretica]
MKFQSREAPISSQRASNRLKQRKHEEVEIRQTGRNSGENHRQHHMERRDEEPRADETSKELMCFGAKSRTTTMKKMRRRKGLVTFVNYIN